MLWKSSLVGCFILATLAVASAEQFDFSKYPVAPTLVGNPVSSGEAVVVTISGPKQPEPTPNVKSHTMTLDGVSVQVNHSVVGSHPSIKHTVSSKASTAADGSSQVHFDSTSAPTEGPVACACAQRFYQCTQQQQQPTTTTTTVSIYPGASSSSSCAPCPCATVSIQSSSSSSATAAAAAADAPSSANATVSSGIINGIPHHIYTVTLPAPPAKTPEEIARLNVQAVEAARKVESRDVELVVDAQMKTLNAILDQFKSSGSDRIDAISALKHASLSAFREQFEHSLAAGIARVQAERFAAEAAVNAANIALQVARLAGQKAFAARVNAPDAIVEALLISNRRYNNNYEKTEANLVAAAQKVSSVNAPAVDVVKQLQNQVEQAKQNAANARTAHNQLVQDLKRQMLTQKAHYDSQITKLKAMHKTSTGQTKDQRAKEIQALNDAHDKQVSQLRKSIAQAKVDYMKQIDDLKAKHKTLLETIKKLNEAHKKSAQSSNKKVQAATLLKTRVLARAKAVIARLNAKLARLNSKVQKAATKKVSGKQKAAAAAAAAAKKKKPATASKNLTKKAAAKVARSLIQRFRRHIRALRASFRAKITAVKKAQVAKQLAHVKTLTSQLTATNQTQAITKLSVQLRVAFAQKSDAPSRAAIRSLRGQAKKAVHDLLRKAKTASGKQRVFNSAKVRFVIARKRFLSFIKKQEARLNRVSKSQAAKLKQFMASLRATKLKNAKTAQKSTKGKKAALVKTAKKLAGADKQKAIAWRIKTLQRSLAAKSKQRQQLNSLKATDASYMKQQGAYSASSPQASAFFARATSWYRKSTQGFLKARQAAFKAKLKRFRQQLLKQQKFISTKLRQLHRKNADALKKLRSKYVHLMKTQNQGWKKRMNALAVAQKKQIKSLNLRHKALIKSLNLASKKQHKTCLAKSKAENKKHQKAIQALKRNHLRQVSSLKKKFALSLKKGKSREKTLMAKFRTGVAARVNSLKKRVLDTQRKVALCQAVKKAQVKKTAAKAKKTKKVVKAAKKVVDKIKQIVEPSTKQLVEQVFAKPEITEGDIVMGRLKRAMLSAPLKTPPAAPTRNTQKNKKPQAKKAKKVPKAAAKAPQGNLVQKLKDFAMKRRDVRKFEIPDLHRPVPKLEAKFQAKKAANKILKAIGKAKQGKIPSKAQAKKVQKLAKKLQGLAKKGNKKERKQAKKVLKQLKKVAKRVKKRIAKKRGQRRVVKRRIVKRRVQRRVAAKRRVVKKAKKAAKKLNKMMKKAVSGGRVTKRQVKQAKRLAKRLQKAAKKGNKRQRRQAKKLLKKLKKAEKKVKKQVAAKKKGIKVAKGLQKLLKKRRPTRRDQKKAKKLVKRLKKLAKKGSKKDRRAAKRLLKKVKKAERRLKRR